MFSMVIQNKDKIIKALSTGTPKEKSVALEKIWEARDVSLVSTLVDILEKEQSRLVKERILILLLDRLIPLSELRDMDVTLHIKRLLRYPELFIRPEFIEILGRLELSNYMKVRR